MSSWLGSLPHQIPFRAASAATPHGEDAIEGSFVCTADDALSESGALTQTMMLEAMAQLAGGLAFHAQKGPGYLSAVENCTIDQPIRVGDVVHIHVMMEARFGGLFRFQATGSIDGVEVARGRFILASAAGSQQ